MIIDISSLSILQQVTALFGIIVFILTIWKFIAVPSRRLEAAMWALFILVLEVRYSLVLCYGLPTVNPLQGSKGLLLAYLGTLCFFYTLFVLFVTSIRVLHLQKRLSKSVLILGRHE